MTTFLRLKDTHVARCTQMDATHGLLPCQQPGGRITRSDKTAQTGEEPSVSSLCSGSFLFWSSLLVKIDSFVYGYTDFEKIYWLFPVIKIFPAWLLHQLPVCTWPDGELPSLGCLGYWFSNWQFSSSSIGLSDTNCVTECYWMGQNLCPFQGHWFEKVGLLIQNINWPCYQSFPERIGQKNGECNLKWQQSSTKVFKLMGKKQLNCPVAASAVHF